MKPINVPFLLDLYRRHYPKEYAASVAAQGSKKPAGGTAPTDPEEVTKAKRMIASTISKRKGE